jgi:anti-sigma factor RsiW
MNDFKNILNEGGSGGKLTDEQLMAYLEGRLSDEERHEVEALLGEEGMESDALEGLQELNAEEAQSIRHKLNTELKNTLGKKRRSRRGLASQQWNIVAIVLLLLLLLVCFFALWSLKHKG